MHGQVSTLLALGVGFNKDLTGRENVMLGGLAAGLPREQLEEKYDEIVEFAELEEFMDMPMRTYSSGMYGRLGFSVAVNMEPDILLIDEALSVGDARFRRKSFDKMRELCQQARTIVLVSHALGSIEELCDVAVWMHKGELRCGATPRRSSTPTRRSSTSARTRSRWRTCDAGRRRVDAVAAVLEEDAVAGRAPGRLRREVLAVEALGLRAAARDQQELAQRAGLGLDRPHRARVAVQPVAQVGDRAVVGRGERGAGANAARTAGAWATRLRRSA